MLFHGVSGVRGCPSTSHRAQDSPTALLVEVQRGEALLEELSHSPQMHLCSYISKRIRVLQFRVQMRRKTPFLSQHQQTLKAPLMASRALCLSTRQGHRCPMGRGTLLPLGPTLAASTPENTAGDQVREFQEDQGGQVQEAPLTEPHLPATFRIGHVSQPTCDYQTCVCVFSVCLLDPGNHCGKFCDKPGLPQAPLAPPLPYGPPLTHGALPLATTYLKANLSTS